MYTLSEIIKILFIQIDKKCTANYKIVIYRKNEKHIKVVN
jgi:hypothetical protein